MRKENRIISICIDWRIIKEFIVDKIKGLPKDVQVIGIRHESYMMFDTIGLYSKKFDMVAEGTAPCPKHIKVEYKLDKDKKRIIDSLEYVK